jgi:DNA-binding FadR family transcriptional regulator
MAFHERMVELVGNRKLLDVYRKLLNELTLYRRQSLAQPGAMDHSATEHREILAAIKSGEGDAAGRVMRDHIMASSGRLQRAHEAPRTRKTK